MPFLRFARDRHGNLSTFLVHTFRIGRKSRSQVLYWSRSPANVRVGRPALDEETVQAIEAAYPDVAFAWVKLRSQRPPPSETGTRVSARARRRQTPVKPKEAGPRGSVGVRRAAKVTAPVEAPATAQADGLPKVLESIQAREVPAEVSAVSSSAVVPAASVEQSKRRRRSRRGGVRRTRRRRGRAEASAGRADGGDEAVSAKPKQSEVADKGLSDKESPGGKVLEAGRVGNTNPQDPDG